MKIELVSPHVQVKVEMNEIELAIIVSAAVIVGGLYFFRKK